MVEQLQLLIRDQQRKVSIDVIAEQPTYKDALKLCKSISGLNDQQLCHALDIDPAQWSRIWSNNAHFPDNKIAEFMRACNNIVPLIWLSLRFGYGIHPLKSELEIENEKLQSQLREKESELSIITNFVKSIKGVN